jgi:hypothetical protein
MWSIAKWDIRINHNRARFGRHNLAPGGALFAQPGVWRSASEPRRGGRRFVPIQLLTKPSDFKRLDPLRLPSLAAALRAPINSVRSGGYANRPSPPAIRCRPKRALEWRCLKGLNFNEFNYGVVRNEFRSVSSDPSHPGKSVVNFLRPYSVRPKCGLTQVRASTLVGRPLREFERTCGRRAHPYQAEGLIKRLPRTVIKGSGNWCRR